MGSLTSRQEWPPVNKGFQKMWEKRLVKTKSGRVLPKMIRLNSCREKGEYKVKVRYATVNTVRDKFLEYWKKNY